jgi:uncharacterized protein YtpQ (UPF0354 family)
MGVAMTRWFLIAGMMACFLGAAHAGEPLDAVAYTDAMATALAEKMPGSAVSVAGELEVSVRGAGGTHTIPLHDLYRQYEREPKLFGEIVDVYVAALTEQPVAPSMPDPARIVPVVKDRQWLADNMRGLKERGVDVHLVYDDLNQDLVVVYAEDSENRVRYLMSNEELPVPREQLRELALANLDRLLPRIEMNLIEDGFAWFSAGGDYEASLILFDGIWSGGKVAMDGDIVVAVPAKDVLFVTGSRNEHGLAAMRQLAAEYATGSYGLTDTLFVYRDGRFERFGGS